MHQFYTQWRKCIRKLFNISPRTHSRYLPLICGDFPVEFQIFKSFINFFKNLLESDNECVSLCCKQALRGSSSIVGKNLCTISNKLNIGRYEIGRKNIQFSSIINKDNTEDDQQAVGVIKDLLYLRDKKTTKFKNVEIQFMLDFLCTEYCL